MSEKLLRIREVKERTTLAQSTIYKMMAEKRVVLSFTSGILSS